MALHAVEVLVEAHVTVVVEAIALLGRADVDRGVAVVAVGPAEQASVTLGVAAGGGWRAIAVGVGAERARVAVLVDAGGVADFGRARVDVVARVIAVVPATRFGHVAVAVHVAHVRWAALATHLGLVARARIARHGQGDASSRVSRSVARSAPLFTVRRARPSNRRHADRPELSASAPAASAAVPPESRDEAPASATVPEPPQPIAPNKRIEARSLSRILLSF